MAFKKHQIVQTCIFFLLPKQNKQKKTLRSQMMTLIKHTTLVLTLIEKSRVPLQGQNIAQPVSIFLLFSFKNQINLILTYFLQKITKQQPKINKPRIAPPMAVMALVVDIPPAPPALSSKISSSLSFASSSTFLASVTN